MKKTKWVIGILFLIIGVILISYPFYFHWKQGQEIEKLTTALHAISNESDIERVQIDPYIKEKVENGVMTLKIPSINLEQPVLSKTTEENLNIALTEIKNNQTPGKGNFTIAGHRSMKTGRFFHYLPNVKKGDIVILSSNGKKYYYVVNHINVVEPTKVEVLQDKKDKKIITLVTCTATGAERVVVQGELEKVISQ